MIDDAQAVRLARGWEQRGSALAKFIRTGEISPAMCQEIAHLIEHTASQLPLQQINQVAHDLYQQELSHLKAYMSAKGTRGPQKNWRA